MKKILIIIISLAIAIPNIAFSEISKTDSIMNIYYQKTKLDKYNEIKSIEIEGEMQVGPDFYYFRLQHKKPNSYRYKERFRDMYVFKLINDNELTAVTKDGKIDMGVMERDVIINLVSYMEGFLTNYKTNNFKLTYLGQDSIIWNPEQVDKSVPFTPVPLDKLPKGKFEIIELTTPTFEKDKIYLDPQTYDIRFTTDNPFMLAKLGPIKFDEYQKVDGYSLPFRIELFSPMFPAIFRFYKIEINKEYPDDIFKSDSPENEVIPGQ